MLPVLSEDDLSCRMLSDILASLNIVRSVGANRNASGHDAAEESKEPLW